MKPTAMPSQASPSTIDFEVTQVLYGIDYTTYEEDADLYDSTLIASIAECMSGVTSSNIDPFTVSAGSRRLLMKYTASATSNVIMYYTVIVDSSYDYNSLSDELQSNIANGQFDSYLTTNAQTAGATPLTTCYSASATTTQTNVNSIDDDTNNSNSSGGLSKGGIAGVVIAILIVVAGLAVVAYLYWARRYFNRSNNDNKDSNVATSKEAAVGNVAPTTANSGAGSSTEFVTLKDIQLTTAPVYGITTITQNKGNAAEEHDNL